MAEQKLYAVISGKLLVLITLAVVGIALIRYVRRSGVVATGWVLGFLGIGIAVVILLALAKPY